MRNFFILAVIHIVSATMACASSFSIKRQYNISDGISDNSVRSIIQDRTGYIWIGTKDGITRFSGDEFRRFGGYPRTSDNFLMNVLKLYPHSDGHKIWIGAVDGLYLFDDYTEEFEPFKWETKSGEKISSLVNDICYDDNGLLWIASSGGLFRYDTEKEELIRYTRKSEDNPIPHTITLSLLKDFSGKVWVGTRNGLACYNETQDRFITYTWKRHSKNNAPYEINHMIETENGEMWIGTHYDGLLYLDRHTGKFSSFNVSIDGRGNNTWIRAVHELNDRYLLIGTEEGLFTFDRKKEKVSHVKTFGTEAIYSITQDHEGGVWLGTYFDGVYYISPQSGNMNLHQEGQKDNSMSGKAISQFCEDQDGNIWIATENAGLNKFDVTTNEFSKFNTSSNPRQRLSHNNIHSLMLDSDHLWIGTFSRGIDIMNIRNNTVVKNYRHSNDNPSSLPDNHIYSIYKTRKGDIFIGTMRGFCRWIPEKDCFESYHELNNIFVYDMIEDDLGKLWIATKNDGVMCMQDGKFTSYMHDPADSTSISNNHILRIYIDSQKRLWLATEGGGICRYDYDNDSFITYDYRKKLYHHIIYGILDDIEGNLWLSSNYGIAKYNPETFESSIYTYEDGLQSNQFNFRSSMKSSDGKFYFGGINGFNSFYPSSLHQNIIKPAVVISDIKLQKKNSTSERIKADSLKRVSIDHHTYAFEISYNCLSYISPSKNRYAYMVNSLHDDWVYTDKPSVTLIDLAPGKYRFMVKAANNDGVWSDTQHIDITVSAPLWRSTAAYILYILLFLTAFALGLKWYLNYLKKDRERDKQNMEMEMQQEIYRSKFQFFTHVAHEIKTPLSLIKAPLEAIMEEGKWNESTKDNLLIMQQNTNRLMELIKQLLNFRKIDKEGYKLTYSNMEAGEFINSTVKRFRGYDNRISIDLDIPEDRIYFNTDVEALTKILSNLLANGLKYASSRIKIRASFDDKNMTISVADDGPGVNEAEIDRIFEPFYRSADNSHSNGFGIGLSMVKLLIEKMGGQIRAGRCNELGGFMASITIPQGQISEPSVKEIEQPTDSETIPEVNSTESNILIVDDTEDVLNFLVKNLRTKYKIYSASNGKEALSILDKHSIDIIVSDIVMPELDGFELLHYVRSDKLLCHIPFVLLSAQGNMNSKIAGLDYGADAFIEKPFSISHIKATIENLLKSRKILFEKFAEMPSLEYGKNEMKKGDVEWMEKVSEIIKRNLTNELFTVDTLASHMAMSRSNLRRKILGLTGLAPNDYIRLIRLKLAAELLKEGKYRVNEVSYLIGFSNQSYFARCFQKQFGVLPKDYIKGINVNSQKDV